jgi:uncharacterized protein (DUF1800 family)
MITPCPLPVRFGHCVRGVFALGILLSSPLYAADKEAAVRYLTPERRLWLDESQVVPFQVAAAEETGRAFEVKVNPPEAVEIIQPPVVLDKEKTGFLRVRAKKAGKAELEIDGRKLSVQIVPNPSAETLAPKPTLISPPAGACVYGTITAGIELNSPSPEDALAEPRIVLPDGKEIVPRAQTNPSPGSARVFAFDVNADDLPPGPLTLQPVAQDARGQRVKGEPVVVNVIRPDSSLMISGACTDRVNDPRPVRFGEKSPRVLPVNAPAEFVDNVSADPAWCFKETIDKAGLYQLTMRVRGDVALGSFPSVGVIVNEGDYALSGSRLVDSAWHRIPVGVPFRLEAGEQFVTARYLNDVSHGKGNDRNLFLQRYELVRVSADEPAPAADSGEPGMMMSGGGGDAMMMGGSGEALVGDPTALRVAFSDRLEGRLVQGPLTLKGVSWRGPNVGVPRVELVVNGETLSRQQGKEVTFRVPLSAMKKGANTLQLRARTDAGHFAESAVESVVLNEDPAGHPERRALRFTVEDDAWDPGVAQKLEKEKPLAAFYVNGDAILTLPNNLEGEYSLQIEARGQEFDGPPVVGAFLKKGDEPLQKIGEQGVKGERSYALGAVQLAKGPKQIVFRFENDAAEAGKGDRNWWLRAASLEQKVAPSEEVPRVSLLFPTRSPYAVGEAGAVVAQVYSPEGIDWADLVIDGQPQNLRLSEESGLGRVVLPVIPGDLKPGEHAMQVRVRGRNGKETTSAAMVLRVGGEKANYRFSRAVHLLNRFGYGPEPEELADVLVMGEKAWLRDRLSRTWSDPGEAAAYRRAWSEQPDAVNKGQVVPRALVHLLRTPNPVRSRFVLWTENHFSTWMEKADALNKWTEHARFLELGVAPFGTLLKASASSPAMLVYLDQNRSFAKKLNENYAREIMELHTVGVNAGYTQEDVTALASVLTGWTLTADAPMRGVAREMARTFRFEPALNAAAEKRVFGMEFPKTEDLNLRQDRTLAAMEMLASHPATAQFISRKLAEHYVSVPAPDSLVKKLSTQFLATGGDMAAMLTTIAESPEFWASASQPKIATPLDFSVRIARLTGSGNAGAVREFLRKSGTGLFERVTPDGYPEADAAYADSNALLQRWRFTLAMSGAIRKLLPNGVLPSEKTPWEPKGQNQALDLVSLRLTGHTLPAASREASLQYLAKVSPPENERAKVVTSLVAQLPPASLR